ncbi:MAG: DUF1013 domain-containing protein [Rickettsiaceae bacterium]|nr:DUF1013 domain-containing protein [Rickettsiaceae bacterium]
MTSSERKIPLMPKATAMWLVDNTSLTFRQIATFCGLHELEIKAMADGDAMYNISPLNPISNRQLTKEEIERCQKDSTAEIKLLHIFADDVLSSNNTKTKYVPKALRRNKLDAILWFNTNYPQIPDNKIAKLLGTTKNTIQAIKEKTHSNFENLRARDPVILGLCTQAELNHLLADIDILNFEAPTSEKEDKTE